MRKLMLAIAVVMACGLFSGPALLQERGGEDETGPYEVVPNWPQPLARPGYALGSQGGVFAESPNRIILVNRGEIKLPDKLPNNFTGAYGSIGSSLTPGYAGTATFTWPGESYQHVRESFPPARSRPDVRPRDDPRGVQRERVPGGCPAGRIG